MPRPDDFTPEMLADCNAEIDRVRTQPCDTEERMFGLVLSTAHGRESWYAGDWLAKKLADAGCPDAEVPSICFANGQRTFMASDPWVPTLKTLADYLAGRPLDPPGAALALKLFREGGGL